MELDATIVVASPEQTEALLDAGQLRCPGCPGALRPHGYGRIRRVRSLCEAPVTALASKARGDGHRTIAAQLGRPVSTVRRWLRRAREPHAD